MLLRPESDWHLINGNNLWFVESSNHYSPILVENIRLQGDIEFYE